MVPIEGKGNIVFVGSGGEHRVFTGVFYIPKMTTNILSLGQLDEEGCAINIHSGTMTLRDEHLKLLARIPRSSSRLYVLELRTTQPVCMAAHGMEAA